MKIIFLLCSDAGVDFESFTFGDADVKKIKKNYFLNLMNLFTLWQYRSYCKKSHIFKRFCPIFLNKGLH